MGDSCTARELEDMYKGQVLDQCVNLTEHQMEVRVNPAFVRANEVKTLCADTSRLESLLGKRALVPLEQTLQWMLT